MLIVQDDTGNDEEAGPAGICVAACNLDECHVSYRFAEAMLRMIGWKSLKRIMAPRLSILVCAWWLECPKFHARRQGGG